MTAVQLDLFRPATDTRRLVEGLTCLRDAVPEAMYVLLHLEYWLPRDERGVGASGGWAYAIRRNGLHFEHTDDWWRGARSRGEQWGWNRQPARHLTWVELAEQLGDDPRRADLAAWSRSLTEPAWKQRARPYEMWPEPETWHPDYLAGDRARSGWPARVEAWLTLQAILTDAIVRARTEEP